MARGEGGAADGSGGIWAGTVRGLGHLTFGPNGEPSTATWRRDAGLPADWVWALLKSRRGELWVGTEEGLSRLLPSGRFATMTTADGLAANYVVSLFEDRSGALWVGAIDGLSRIRLDAAGRPAEVRNFGAARPPSSHSIDGCNSVCATSTTAAAGSTILFGMIRRSKSVTETATSVAQKNEAIAASSAAGLKCM